MFDSSDSRSINIKNLKIAKKGKKPWGRRLKKPFFVHARQLFKVTYIFSIFFQIFALCDDVTGHVIMATIDY